MKRHAAGLLCAGLLFTALACTASAARAVDLVIATVNNGHMIELQKLGRFFEKDHPDIRLKWVTLEEGVLRQRVTTDVATGAGQFDVVTITMYETPMWAKKGWLQPVRPGAAYDIDDLLPAVRDGLSLGGTLYAAPFYGESSMVMYRDDLLARAGLAMPERPTWDQVRAIAAKIHDPAHGVYGICLRGKPGWGDNMALLTTMANAYGGQLFDMRWQPQFTAAPWRNAVATYVDLLRRYGPPGSSSNGFNELLALFNQGRCGIWVDATVAAAFVSDPQQSTVAGKVAFAQAPSAVTARGASWLNAWALAIPQRSRQPAAAQQFVDWATSKGYVGLVAREAGWRSVPTGTRRSTYANPAYRKAAPFAAAENQAFAGSSPRQNTLPPSPYVGVHYAAIPEFQAIGVAAGQQIAAALLGKATVQQALEAAQAAADRTMRKAGYYGQR